MCFGWSLPDPAGRIIAELKKGDEITIEAGYGFPTSDESRTLVVYNVDQFSALCTDGTRLSCRDGNGVKKTGRNVPAKASMKVMQILLAAQMQKVVNWFEGMTDDFRFEMFLLKRRLKNLKRGKY